MFSARSTGVLVAVAGIPDFLAALEVVEDELVGSATHGVLDLRRLDSADAVIKGQAYIL